MGPCLRLTSPSWILGVPWTAERLCVDRLGSPSSRTTLNMGLRPAQWSLRGSAPGWQGVGDPVRLQSAVALALLSGAASEPQP